MLRGIGWGLGGLMGGFGFEVVWDAGENDDDDMDTWY